MPSDFTGVSVVVPLPDADDPTKLHRVRLPPELARILELGPEKMDQAVTFRQRQQEAGRKGGRSRSPRKVAAVRANIAKARAARWERHRLMQQTPEQAGRPALSAPVGPDGQGQHGQGQQGVVFGVHYQTPPPSDTSDLSPEEAAQVVKALALLNQVTAEHNRRMMAMVDSATGKPKPPTPPEAME